MYKHITEKQRQMAQDLWQQFNTKLVDLHMKLYYDCYKGTFFVTDSRLVPAMDSSDHGLNREDLERVVDEGCFEPSGTNPPWFVDYTNYTLKESEV